VGGVNGPVEIDRISLRVPGLDRAAARRLAQQVALRLADGLRLAPGEASLERLRIELNAQSGEHPDALAGRIAAQLVRLIGEASTLEAGR
jgi:hypothetical protein